MSNALFTTVPVPKFPRSTFNLSRPVLFTPRMHKEYPTEILEVIPGDGFKVWAEAYAKSQPMVAPTFAKMDIAQESFFVPAWQLSERFDDFITGGERGMNTDKMPYVTVGEMFVLLDGYLANYCEITENLHLNWQKYNERLTKVQDIIESFDIMRSIPFAVPDFVLLSSGMSETDAENVAVANGTAFYQLNGDCNDSELRINLLPFAAVLKIWCEFYRDENLCEDLYAIYWKGEGDPQEGFNGFEFHKSVGNVDAYIDPVAPKQSDDYINALHALFGLKSRAWKKDYFTSALPFVQKGPDVVLPMDAAIDFYGPSTAGESPLPDVVWKKDTAGAGVGNIGIAGVPFTNIEGRINGARIGTTIQDVRTAFKLEELYEADGRFGNRYPENTLGQFGIRTPDSRLPRCQYLGGSKQPIQIQQVIQNSSTDATSPQGNLAGLSSTYGSNKLFKTYQSQHGFVVCLACIRVHALYQQGIHPMFSRYDRTEYAWPRFANLGEQPIYTKQLDVRASEDEVFGYTPRYADYKSDTGSIHGKLKGSLNYWTMARRFANKPVLNENFIYSRPRQDAFVVNNWLEPCFIMEIDYHVRANRVLPFYGSPHI